MARRLGGWYHGNGLRPGARGQIIARAGQLNIRNASQAMMTLMNFELLPPGR